MLKYLCILTYCFLVSLSLTNAETAVRVVSGGSFRFLMFPTPLDNSTRCTLTCPRGLVTNIPLDYKEGNAQTAENQRIEPLGNGQCGARVHGFQFFTDSGKWILTLSNKERSISESFRVSSVSWETPVNRTTVTAIGTEAVTIPCGPSTNVLYCEMRDPSGNLVQSIQGTRCEIVVERLTTSHFGEWTCTVGVVGSASEIYATHTLEIQENRNGVVIFANETSLGTSITWQVLGLSGTSIWCRAFSPNGETIMILPGMDNDRFVSVGTNLAEHRCGFLINGDFSEEYHGVWRLEIGVNARRTMGGFIRMPEGSIPEPEGHIAAKNESRNSDEITEMTVVKGNSFRISCETQYSAGYCWIRGPLGQEFTHSENLTVGRCAQVINASTVNDHSGIWTCNMGHVNGGSEKQFLTKVSVVENSYRAVNPEMQVYLGEKVVIACRSVLEFPLEYCRFIRPDGRGFGVVPSEDAFDRYSYEGPGLDYGYCGLAISSVEAVDMGEWRCATRSRHRLWEAEVWDTSVLDEIETVFKIHASNGIIVKLAAGAILMLAIIIVLTVLWQKRKSLRRDSQKTDIISISS